MHDPHLRDAATVLMIRDVDAPSGGGVRVWMMRRKETLAFAPGAWVFPGGVVEPTDSAPISWSGRSLESLAEVMACPADRALCLLAAAVRETFEECGVLVATTTRTTPSETDRRDLIANRIGLAEVLSRHDAVIDGDALTPWAWWLTPPASPRRYDTWFFVTPLLPDDVPRHIDDGEGTVSAWVSPGELLRQHHTGDALLLPPTLEALQRLDRARSVAEVLADSPPRLAQRSG